VQYPKVFGSQSRILYYAHRYLIARRCFSASLDCPDRTSAKSSVAKPEYGFSKENNDMTRKSTALYALTLIGLALLAWLGVSRSPAHAQFPGNPGAANPGMGLSTVGTATTAAADGQGSVVLTYPNGIVAVVKPSSMETTAGTGRPQPQPQSPIAVYRIRANGLVERLSLPFPPIIR